MWFSHLTNKKDKPPHKNCEWYWHLYLSHECVQIFTFKHHLFHTEYKLPAT